MIERLPDLDEEALQLEDRLVDALRVALVDLRDVPVAIVATEELLPSRRATGS